MSNTKQIWAWIGVVAVLLVILALLGGFTTKQGQAPVPVGTPTYAPAGQLVQGFPSELILDTSAQLQGSYSINYASTTDQYTASWNSSKSLSAIYSQYKIYLQSNGWTISNEMTAYKGTMGLHAEKGNVALGLSVVENGSSRKITVTYVTQ